MRPCSSVSERLLSENWLEIEKREGEEVKAMKAGDVGVPRFSFSGSGTFLNPKCVVVSALCASVACGALPGVGCGSSGGVGCVAAGAERCSARATGRRGVWAERSVRPSMLRGCRGRGSGARGSRVDPPDVSAEGADRGHSSPPFSLYTLLFDASLSNTSMASGVFSAGAARLAGKTVLVVRLLLQAPLYTSQLAPQLTDQH